MRIAVISACAVIGAAGAAAKGEIVYGVTLDQTLIRWDSATPGTLLGGSAIAGLAVNETVRGIDFRPATGELYALGSFGNLYTLNTVTGAATMKTSLNQPLSGSSFGADFNPVVDRFRVISDADQNLRVNPSTGATLVDGALNYAAGDVNFGRNPNAVHAGYTNSFAGAASTTLYVLDTGLDVLAIQSPPNNGTLTTVGSVGTDLTDIGGFDISGLTGKAYAAVRDATLAQSTFWSIDLATGQGTMVGAIGGGSIVTAMAIVPAPGAMGLLCGAAGVFSARRRRR